VTPRVTIFDYGAGNNIVTKIVCFANGYPFVDPGSGHPNGKTARMMVSAIIVRG
jgi:hypothetical protein